MRRHAGIAKFSSLADREMQEGYGNTYVFLSCGLGPNKSKSIRKANGNGHLVFD